MLVAGALFALLPVPPSLQVLANWGNLGCLLFGSLAFYVTGALSRAPRGEASSSAAG